MVRKRKAKKAMNLSPSKVDAYFGCPQLFKYRYIDKIPTYEKKYFKIGNAIHAVLEDFHKTIESYPKEEWKSHTVSLFRSAIEKYHVKQHKDIEKKDLLAMRDMVKGYLKESYEKGLPKIVSLEKLFKVKINNGIVIWGKADRVDQLDDKVYKIVDYKTSAQPMSKKDARESVQLPTYKMWLSELKGSDIKVFGEYVYVRHMGTKKAFQTFEVTNDWVEEAKNKYLLVQEELNKKEPIFRKNTSYKYCYKACEYRDRCFKRFIL